FCYACYADHRALHSFPTRRSSDLPPRHCPLQPLPDGTPARASPLRRHPARRRDRALQRGLSEDVPAGPDEGAGLGLAGRGADARTGGPGSSAPVEPLLALRRASASGPCPRLCHRRLDRRRPLPVAGPGCNLATRARELRRTLRPDAPPPRRGAVRTRPAPPFLERRPSGDELAAHQPAAPFGPPLQAGPPLPAPADL